MPMVEEFELLEEAEVQFEDSDCAESVWHGVGYSLLGGQRVSEV